jgi:hypothetical protein
MRTDEFRRDGRNQIELIRRVLRSIRYFALLAEEEEKILGAPEQENEEED